MSLAAIFKGDYITAVELGPKKPTLTIKNVELVKMEDEKTGKMKDKPVVFFTEIERGWVLCKTTAICIDAMFAIDGVPLPREKLAGKRVTIKSEVVQVGKEKKPGVRVVGSPDIDKSIDVTIKFPKKKAVTVTLIKTGVAARGGPQSEQAMASVPPPTDADAPPPEYMESEVA